MTDGLCLDDGSYLEAVPFSGAHKGVWYCQVLSHVAAEVAKGSQKYLDLSCPSGLYR